MVMSAGEVAVSDKGILEHADPSLLADIRRYGMLDPTGCYQCGSCTLSCDLVTEHVSVPRKVLRYALLGLRRSLVSSFEPWICHDCGDCSTICPRQAEPRISMMTTRRFLTAQYDRTGIASRILRSRAWYIGSLVSVAAVVLLLIVLYHVFYEELTLQELATTSLDLEHMFPIMTYFTLAVTIVPLLLLSSNAVRMWSLTMHRGGQKRIPISVYAAQAGTYLWNSVAQPLMRKCAERSRWKWHWLLAAGVAVKFAILVFALRWFQTDSVYPLYNPQRWVGYLVTISILLGAGGILLCHIRGVKEVCRTSTLEDVMFPILLLLTAASGIAVHLFRYAGLALTCHYAYALHVVVATPMLVVEIPFGKTSHMIYRPLAVYFQAVRERARLLDSTGESVDHAA